MTNPSEQTKAVANEEATALAQSLAALKKDEIVMLQRLVAQITNSRTESEDSDKENQSLLELAPLQSKDETEPLNKAPWQTIGLDEEGNETNANQDNNFLSPPRLEQTRELMDENSLRPESLIGLSAVEELPNLEDSSTSIFSAVGNNLFRSFFARQKEEVVERHSPFNESIFTLIYMCKFRSHGFWYGLFVYIIQLATISLTLVDIIDYEGSGNVLRLPPMVDLTVTLAQGVALLLAMAFQSDLIEAILKLQDGFYPEVLEMRSGATYSTWLLSCLAQLFAGLLLLLTIFVLTIQVDSVLNIMLNFAALHFMAEIDDLGFALAKMGFITNELQRVTIEVADFQVPKRVRRNLYRRVLFFLAFVGIFMGYGVLKQRQIDGFYLPSYVYVQFGDAYLPHLPYYSGLLSSGNVRTSHRREYRDVQTQNILLAYCSSDKAWTFSQTNDPCDYFAKSQKIKTYDVRTIPDSSWHVHDQESRPKPFDYFTLTGRDCAPESCHGECIDGLCHCPHDRFGLDCEFDNVCPELVLHGSSEPFPMAMPWAISDNYVLLANNETGDYVRVNSMPVYYSTKTYRANIIFFGGRRWVLTSEYKMFNVTEVRAELGEPLKKFFPQKIAEILHEDYHGHHESKHTPYFLSAPVDFETPAFMPTPADVSWFTVKILNETARLFAPDRPVDSVLTCADCRVDHGGSCDSNGGVCNQTTGVCDCYSGYYGHKCEREDACYEMDRPCWGDGACDQVSGVCRCNRPFYSKLCEITKFCYEEEGKCRNGGVCNFTSNYCDCPDDPAITGWACEKRKHCKVFGCDNGGTCDEDTGICDCPDRYYGFLCSLINETKQSLLSCLGDSESNNLLLCSEDYNCTASGCKNEGLCNAETGDCECIVPFEGRDCSEVPDCTSDDDCIGGGWCAEGNGDCDCFTKFASGKRCEDTSYKGCFDVGCYNGGICQTNGYCECAAEYSGPRCEFVLHEDAYARD